jgi:hypothetical protein
MNNNMTTKPQDQRDIEAREALSKAIAEGRDLVRAQPAGWLTEDDRIALAVAEMYMRAHPKGGIDTANRLEDILTRPAPEALGAAIPGDVETAVRMAFEATNETQYTPLCKYWFRKGYGYGLEALGAAKWQPIETAPKDGTPLILFARYIHATASIIVVGHFLQTECMWINTSFGNAAVQQIVPLHWMPLPAAPTAKDQS